MPAGKDWHRRLPAVLHLAQVISAAKDAGSYEPQMMPVHHAARLATRVARFARMQKATPATARDWLGEPELQKTFPLVAAANIAATVGPMIAQTRWGQRALSWGARSALSLGRKVGLVSGGAARATRAASAGAGVSGWTKFRRNPGRAALGVSRHVGTNRGSYGLALGSALGGYEADRAWREASPQRRMMGDV